MMSEQANADGATVITENLEPHPAALILPAMEQEEFEKFKIDIKEHGLIEPIALFEGRIIDGIHRYQACKELGIDARGRTWEGGMDPVAYVVTKNIHRRHLSAGQKAIAATKVIEYYAGEAKKRRQEHGKTAPGRKKTLPELVREVSVDKHDNETTAQAGKMLGVSGRSVDGAKYILTNGTEEEKKTLVTGKAAIKPLEKAVRERVRNKPASKPTFNKATDSIEWAKLTWNPVTGCKHGCPYCYARDIANRSPENFPQGFEPMFFEDRLAVPVNTKLPEKATSWDRSVFVCSMADLFGEWVPQDWIDKVLLACEQAPEWHYIFLTKNPSRLVDIKRWPEHSWVGTTVDRQEKVAPAVKAFQIMARREENRPSVLFLSCGPLLESVSFGDELKYFDWVSIGAQCRTDGAPAYQPEWPWVEALHREARNAHCSVHWESNLTVRPKERPAS
ncbi:MAG: DUF5131 family protein [Syntrophales bacterium]